MKKTIEEYLKIYKSECPAWLANHVLGTGVNISDVLKTRNVYYPGAGVDGQPIKTFNSAQFAHLFVYVDYGMKQDDIENRLAIDGLKGYKSIDKVQLKEVNVETQKITHTFIQIFEKNNIANEIGSDRFALLYICADGIAAYNALFGKNLMKIDLLVLQDHGFGGNYDKFGKGGLMEKIAIQTGAYPEYILCEDNDTVWSGYEVVEGLDYVVGGMHLNQRYLFKRTNK